MQDDVTVPLYRLSSTIVTYINNELRPYHLTFQQLSILIFLKKQGKATNVKDIGVYLRVSHPTVVGLVSRMVIHNFLLMRTLESDRRQTIVTLSKHGKKILEETETIIENVNNRFFESLGQQEYEKFSEMILSLEKIFKI